jgi:hypothetical protein
LIEKWGDSGNDALLTFSFRIPIFEATFLSHLRGTLLDLTDFDIVFGMDEDGGKSGGPVERRKVARLAVDEGGCWNEWTDDILWTPDIKLRQITGVQEITGNNVLSWTEGRAMTQGYMERRKRGMRK